MLTRDKITKIFSYFRYSHLPDRLQVVSRSYHDLAYALVNDAMVMDEEQALLALTLLLQAKDAAVRAYI